MIKFTIPGEPVGKGRPRFSTRGKFVKAYTPETTVNYENWVKICFQESKQEALEGQLRATIKCYLGIPQSYSKKKKLQCSEGIIRPTKKPDLDNIAKIILDSLNGLAYQDDKIIVSCNIDKWFSNDARVEVTIEQI